MPAIVPKDLRDRKDLTMAVIEKVQSLRRSRAALERKVARLNLDLDETNDAIGVNQEEENKLLAREPAEVATK